MGDLISRQVAIEDLINTGINKIWDTADVELWVNGLPSAQPEIIHCRDCKYYEIAQLTPECKDDRRYKPSICVKGKYAICRKPDWYCGDAERREK